MISAWRRTTSTMAWPYFTAHFSSPSFHRSSSARKLAQIIGYRMLCCLSRWSSRLTDLVVCEGFKWSHGGEEPIAWAEILTNPLGVIVSLQVRKVIWMAKPRFTYAAFCWALSKGKLSNHPHYFSTLEIAILTIVHCLEALFQMSVF